MNVGANYDAIEARLNEPCVVCMVGAVKRAPGGATIKGDAYLGTDLEFSTLDPFAANVFKRYDAERFANHWRGWYSGFAGGVQIEVRDAPVAATA